MYFDKSDLWIWNEFKNGNISAYEYIYKKYLPILYNYGFKITKEGNLIQDCIQEIFITILEKKEKLSKTDSIKFYLFKALKRRLIRELKKSNQINENNSDFDAIFTFDNIDDLDISEDQSKILVSILNDLPARQKEAITLKFYDNFSYEEISQIMNIEVSSTYKIIYKAIKNLHQKLNKEESFLFINYVLILSKIIVNRF